jgi:23S rRNA pseudouridine955/2504/2580 synthase
LKQFTIQKNDAGARLDRFVSKSVPLLPPALAQKYIRLKRIKRNGRGSKRDARLEPGDTVEMYINDEFFETPGENNAFLRIHDPVLSIVYEDENLLLLDKKAGVLSHPDGGFDYSTLIVRAQAYLYQKREWDPRKENSFAPALCNRIDRNTSGIVIAAKTAEALRIINDKIKAREIDKYYLAAVAGAPPASSGLLEGWIFKDASKNQVFVSDGARPGASYAATEYRAIASLGGLTLLECKLLTGRTHQIRAQLAHAGCAILGDGKYGSERTNRKYGEHRQLLCSYRLAFSFKTDAGALEYLKNREFKLEHVDFREKYFGRRR